MTDTTPTLAFEHHVLGKLFGFPECCIQDFVARLNGPRTHRRGLRGYVPCSSCSQLDDLELIRRINQNRITPTSFPKMPEENDLEAILSDPRLDATEREWLRENAMRFTGNEPDGTERHVHDMVIELDRLRAVFEEKVRASPQDAEALVGLHEIERLNAITTYTDRMYKDLRAALERQYQMIPRTSSLPR